ncbi:4'-phosphopantetheinyl transferase superfamily protein [Aetokthonos hydrillicola Thurmond2011]|uniref:4'-phosphopantetheinyl transferase superfamily protein n=1 Tax=Aetokthonos hydrillicola Thurmond2011 TaxID=2712845 RepID=A0AAP5I9H9_9CYAN|nr:4'-phosphopantetheinyl transferase HetI [Aetokthonos hydrillicola]MBO3461047.1 4'-phosphopantetheinyl transferase superfamily protein [Aetokthonos hydrillicola CCALA 1050]MBW4586300.1 4'-phosphopantetheinyl transferase superfamily protein [Aetokthonos hydrillicola CCALA 1050]MDR9897428.1 4'-phosphopantetheinyl transferase superfamily protein [Aetokthonos hydrillicola Thurmond2011]
MTAVNHQWLPGAADLTLLQDDVHIWRVNLDLPETQLQHLTEILSSDELSRAKRFYKEQHRHRFIAGRGILRTILSRYLGIEPQQLQFCYESLGKPILAENLRQSKLQFNLTHSQGLALCVVSCDRLVGIDLEYLRPISDVLNLAKRYFSPAEYSVMRSLPSHQMQEVFFRYWTCKEAYLKATGAGIAQLEEIEVFLTPTEPAKLNIDKQWSLFELVPVKNTVAAVAAEGIGLELKLWEYTNGLDNG